MFPGEDLGYGLLILGGIRLLGGVVTVVRLVVIGFGEVSCV